MRILCTNDDGYLSPGIRVLAEAARAIGSVDVVAPDRERSASSSSLTLHRPLRKRRVPDGATIVDGTPTDCIVLAVMDAGDRPPDLCVCGINHGPNLGEDVLYSGTVAAAMEATIQGVPSVAFSYVGRGIEEVEGWQDVVSNLLKQIVAQEMPRHEFLNVNLPACSPSEVKGLRVTNLGRRRYSDAITCAPDPSGREYYWIGGGYPNWNGGPDADFRAVQEGYVSVTPMHLDLTSYTRLDDVRKWNLTP